ncbi:DUF4097 family beta strand repeat-containing protein [Longispora albida]|uniref:DUF4097 family beta strand repeat-containing protein n=1 Tax=Longispora albida TaxID=203523 RepID=UPI0012FC009C|nr:DUF4097 family beta strand repeat-containing protein [Longispora albida]
MTTAKILMAGAAGLLLAGTVSGCRIESGDRTETSNAYEVAEVATRLEITGKAGSVRVVASSGPIKVRERVKYKDKKVTTRHAVAGGVLKLTDDCVEDCEVGYTVQIPAATVAAINLGEGSIAVEDLTGDLDLRTEGQIEGIGLGGKRVKATGDSGRISLSFAAVPDDVTAKNTAGEVTIAVPSGTKYKVKTSRSAGSAKVTVDTDDSSAHAITAGTDVGDVVVKNS